MHNSRLLGASTHRCDERLLERTSIALACAPRTCDPAWASAAADLGRLNRLAGGRADERRSSDPPFVGVSARSAPMIRFAADASTQERADMRAAADVKRYPRARGVGRDDRVGAG